MTIVLEDRVLDFGLNALHAEATHFYICSSEPTTYAQATGAARLGVKSFGAGSVFGVVGAGTAPSGRKVSLNTFADGSIQTAGTASWWAVVDATNSRLLAHNPIAAPQHVVVGDLFGFATFDIKVANVPANAIVITMTGTGIAVASPVWTRPTVTAFVPGTLVSFGIAVVSPVLGQPLVNYTGNTVASPDRLAVANWQGAGMQSRGGIPIRSTIYTTLNPSGGDDTTQIQNALNNCPAGQVVKLSAGDFTFNQNQNPLVMSNSITLRGTLDGAGNLLTRLKRGTGSTAPRQSAFINNTSVHLPDPNSQNGDNSPCIIIGPGRFSGVDTDPSKSSNLTVDGAQGAYSIVVANGAQFTQGRFVLLDEMSMASWQANSPGFLDANQNYAPSSEGSVKVWRGDRCVYAMNLPSQPFIGDSNSGDAAGPFDSDVTNGTTVVARPPNSMTWFLRQDRPTSEIKEIASIVGNVITFTSPLTISYRTSHNAQLTSFTNSPSHGNSVHLTGAGLEDLSVYLFGGGSVEFNCCAYSWAKHVEIDTCYGLGMNMSSCFRVEIRDSHFHTSAWPVPAADSYALCFQWGSSECLVENNIMRDYCKVSMSRCSGAGSVIGYNYLDDGFDWYGSDGTQYFVECGVNGSHMVGPHHMLFEGNYSFNFDSDYTHGNSIYQFIFRNHLSGQRASFQDTGHQRCGSGAVWSWWLTYIGNILGRPGQMAGWVYTDQRMGCDVNGNNCVGFPLSGWTRNNTWNDKAIWKIGYNPAIWSNNPDQQTIDTLVRDGNYDFLTNSQRWHNTTSGFQMPSSMYLTAKPAFFGANPWPWTDPVTGVIHVLPAKARYDAGTPNIVP